MKNRRFQQRDNRRVGLLFSSDETYAKRMEELNAASQNPAKRGLRANRQGRRNQDQAAPETLADLLGDGDVRGDQGEQGSGDSIPEFATAPSDYDPDFDDPDFDAPAADTGCNDDDGLSGTDLGWGFIRA